MANSLRELLRRRSTAVNIAVIVVLAIAILALTRRNGHVKYVTTPVTRGSVVASVEATGTINPLTTAPVGS